ncbi:hypothetical protein [Microvirga yunnanensis]|uniref:hypothetical protein n=1 Tax=Microvirga yunnanensis TaxID=2953740 RepID=UPI0021C7F694|nr:hypothetical protein [Microvirga sp. HBU65207]
MSSISLSELARRIGRDKALVSRWAQQGKIPRLGNGNFDEEAVRRSLKGKLDPARARPLAPVNTDTSVNASGPTIPLTHEDDLQPKSEQYRERKDIGDAFMRGLYFGLHRMAFDVPVYATEAAISSGAPARVAYAIKALMAEAICGLIHDVSHEMGVSLEDGHGPYFIPTHLSPPAFYDISPERLAGLAREPVNLSAWQAWEQQAQVRLSNAR